MTGRAGRLRDWQRRLHAQPQVWTVALWRGNKYSHGELYDSREAAEVEAAYRRAHGERAAHVITMGHVHNLELARERWEGPG